MAAASHSAISRGVARTGTSPDPSEIAVSSSATFNSAMPARPVTKPITVTIRAGIVAQPNPGGGGAAIAAPPLGRPSAKGPPNVIEEPVIERVLAAGLSTGADFAEVFA